MLYVAYGSNIGSEIKNRCPSAKAIGSGYILGYELNFYYYADIDINSVSNVPCVVYDIADEDWDMLDYYEGYPTLYGRHYVDCIVNGEHLKAIAYEMNFNHKKYSMPSNSYFDRVVAGYMEFGLDLKYLKERLNVCTKEVK